MEMIREAAGSRRFQDTMISARNYDRLVGFYTRFMGLELLEQNGELALLRDASTGQTLCVTNGPAVEAPSPAVAVDDLERAVLELETLGGRVRKRWMIGMFEGANCEDPEGNGIMLWQRRESLVPAHATGDDADVGAPLSLA
jgi:catechol 2,3-dioxygenase-like lactoylglutathione lyase family enzyme